MNKNIYIMFTFKFRKQMIRGKILRMVSLKNVRHDNIAPGKVCFHRFDENFIKVSNLMAWDIIHFSRNSAVFYWESANLIGSDWLENSHARVARS